MKTTYDITAGEGAGVHRITDKGVDLLPQPVEWQGSHEATARRVAELMNSPTVIAWANGTTVVWGDRTTLQRAWFYIGRALCQRRS